MVSMRDTKRLRKSLTVPLLDLQNKGEKSLEIDLLPLKKPPFCAREIDDSWSGILGEPREFSNLYYEKGVWHLESEKNPAKETRDGIIWDNIPKPRSKRAARKPAEKDPAKKD